MANQQLSAEFEYLSPRLQSMSIKTAVDVGAHLGTVTVFLQGLGFQVVSLEPNPDIPFGVKLAASDEDGWAELMLGRCSAVSSLEPTWVTTVFPNEFSVRRSLPVRTRKLSTLLPEMGVTEVGFLKVDAEGWDCHVLRGFFDGTLPPAKIVMFEANQLAPDYCRKALTLLVDKGYHNFRIFIREGDALLATVEFNGPTLPPEWSAFPNRAMYANVMAWQ